MKLFVLIISVISAVLAIISNGNFFTSMRDHKLVRIISGAISIYAILLLVVNFEHDSIEITNLFNHFFKGTTTTEIATSINTDSGLSQQDIDILHDIENNGVIEPTYIDNN